MMEEIYVLLPQVVKNIWNILLKENKWKFFWYIFTIYTITNIKMSATITIAVTIP